MRRFWRLGFWAMGIVWVSVLIAFAPAHAQTATPVPWNGIEQVASVSQCLLHGTDNVTCVALDGIRVSQGGNPFVDPVAAEIATAVAAVKVTAGVQTFNHRAPDAAGNIAPAPGDYGYGQIAGTPTIPSKAVTTVTSTATTTLQ